MNLRVLRCFVEVVRNGGFSAAARIVCATQSTVSKAVRSLEDEYGTPLLDRSNGVALTAAGETVYRRALAILAEKEALDAELGAQQSLQHGTLRFGVPPVACDRLFARPLSAFHARYPGIRMVLHEAGCYALEEMVLRGELEMILALLPVSERFETAPLCDEPLIAVLPEGHPLCGRPCIRLEDLDGSPFIQFEQGFALNPRIRDACLRRGVSLRETLCSSQMAFIISLVAAGLGVALIPRLMLAEGTPAGVVTAHLDADDLRWQGALAWRKGHTLSPPAKAWLDIMAEMPPRLSQGLR